MCYSWYRGRVYEIDAFVHSLRFGAGDNRAGVYARHRPYETFVAVQGNDAAEVRETRAGTALLLMVLVVS